jgi:hypothetical protein
MKITRRGATKDHGPSSIEFTKPSIGWVKADTVVTLKQGHVKDFSTGAHHSYTVRITSPEVTQIIAVLAAAAVAEPEAFEEEFSPALKALVQLTGVVSGLYSK